jgi:hypothetical protein
MIARHNMRYSGYLSAMPDRHHPTSALEPAMKINVTVDTTPEELRTFFGLPDLGPLQQEWLGQIQAQMKHGMEAMDPTTLMALNPAFAGQMKLLEAMQKNFWQAFAPGSGSSK